MSFNSLVEFVRCHSLGRAHCHNRFPFVKVLDMRAERLDVRRGFVKYLGLSHIVMCLYGCVLIKLYIFQTPPVGAAHTALTVISMIFVLINMIGIVGVFGEPVRVIADENYFSFRSIGVATLFLLSAGFFMWLMASFGLSQITIWSRT